MKTLTGTETAEVGRGRAEVGGGGQWLGEGGRGCFVWDEEVRLLKAAAYTSEPECV